MKTSNKFNPVFNIRVFIPLAIILVAFFFATAFIDISAGLVVMVLAFSLYSIYSLWAYLQTRSIVYFAAFLFQILMTIYFLTVPEGMMPIGSKDQAFFFYFCGLIVGIWLVYLMVSQKGKWKGRNVFELVAKNITDTVNGFTERPRHAGKMEYSKSELFGFAEYLRRNLIAMPYVEDKNIVFVPVKMGDEYPFLLGFAGDHRYHSWVAFGFDGNVSASISKKDYLAYNEEFSFDQLCDSMGKIFIEFMEYYKKDEGERIIHRLRSVRVGLMA